MNEILSLEIQLQRPPTTHVRVAMVFSAAIDESWHVPDEIVMELTFVIWNHQQVYMMFPVSVLGSTERTDFVVFAGEKNDAGGWI